MRAAIFFIFLCSIFFYGGEYANVKRTDSSRAHCFSSQNVAITQHDSLANSDQYNKIFEDTNLDSGEENHIKDDASNKFSALKIDTANKFFLSLSGFFIFKNDFKGIKNFQPFFAYSQPIYILQRVLRI